jgi:hypothetical protein
VLFAYAFVLSFAGYSHESSSPTGPASNISVGEGTVAYFAGGGTAEMPYPPGFILTNFQWMTSPPDPSYGMIYLDGKVDSSFIDERVRVLGVAFVQHLTGSPPSYQYECLRILVDADRHTMTQPTFWKIRKGEDTDLTTAITTPDCYTK